MPDISWNTVKDQKWTISLAGVAAAILFFWNVAGWSEAWHVENFISKVEAAEVTRGIENRLTKVMNQVETNSETLEDHVDEFRAYAAISRVGTLEEKLARHEDIHDEGEPCTDRSEHKEIMEDLDDAKAYEKCIFDKRKNCHLLVNHR